jgi:UDP:flavonoid glycosyltransferase YjiC (YdhE family)
MTTILFFPFDLLSHYLRCLVLADGYDKKTTKIYFLRSPTYNKFVVDHGYQTFLCEQFNSQHVMDCSRNFDFSWLNQQDIERVTLAQISIIQEFKPDMVIGDTAPCLKMAAEYTRTPYTALMNGYMTKYYAFTRNVPRMHKAYKFLHDLPVPVSDAITDLAEKFTFKKIHRPFKNLRKKLGLKAITDYISEVEGDHNLICDLPSLFPQKELPLNYVFTGPLMYEHQGNEEQWLSALNSLKPIICVCMGSSGDWERLKFLNDRYYDRYTIITAGDHKKVLYAAHILSKEFVNLRQVLKKSSLLICHGGNGTIYSGITSNVFMLCLSSHFEQEWNLHAVQKFGYGKSADQYTELNWRTEIEQIVKCSCIQEAPSLVKELY